jgi:integrase
LQGYWRPKSISGSRIIPITLEEVYFALKDYKDNYESLKLRRKRIDPWWSVKKLGKEVLNLDIYPHALRSTYISILADYPEMTPNKLIKLTGHKGITSLTPYVHTERKEAIRIVNEISRDAFKMR